MPKHILFIDPIEKLVPKKDSSLLLAHELREAGEDVKILYKYELYLNTNGKKSFSMSNFNSSLDEDFYIKNFDLLSKEDIVISNDDTIHMRLEPPFDLSYMRCLWILDYLKREVGCKIINDPAKIFLNNEKITSFVSDNFIETYIGSSCAKFIEFVERLKQTGVSSLILKPVDLFQGIGVQKVELNMSVENLSSIFQKMVFEFKGAVVAQPFQETIHEGEVRSIYYGRNHIGSIKKTPKRGSYLANIAQGATFEKHDLTSIQKSECEKVCSYLGEDVPWIAFDIIGNKISEVNITCPGLLVEVSKAEGRNLAAEIVRNLLS